MNFTSQVATTTAYAVTVISQMFNAVFVILQSVLPYAIGMAVLGGLLALAWRIFSRRNLA